MRSSSLALLAIALAPAGAGASAKDGTGGARSFGAACELLLEMPYGTDVRTIEASLGLDPGKRQIRQDENYGGTVFTYSRGDGLVVDLGVAWIEPNAHLPAGKHAYRGHHTIAWKGKVWHRWEYRDGRRLEFFGLADRGHD